MEQRAERKERQCKRRKKLKETEEDDCEKQQRKMRDTASYMFCFVNTAPSLLSIMYVELIIVEWVKLVG
jgi:hypothetical protein